MGINKKKNTPNKLCQKQIKFTIEKGKNEWRIEVEEEAAKRERDPD
jgi:hypothetical protein